MSRRGRRLYRLASGWLLLAAGGHLAGHYRYYIATDGFDPARRAAMEAMQALIVFPPLGTSLWTVLCMFSLAFALLLALFGVSHWILGREAEPRALQRHALRNTVLFALATLAIGALHPAPQALVIFAGAALLYGASAVALARR